MKGPLDLGRFNMPLSDMSKIDEIAKKEAIHASSSGIAKAYDWHERYGRKKKRGRSRTMCRKAKGFTT